MNAIQSPTFLTVCAFVFAAAAGGIARYAWQQMFVSRFQSVFPYATLTINMCGCFAIGAIHAVAAAHVPLMSQMTIVFLGAFTTFSTFNEELLRMLLENRVRAALIYGTISFAGGLLLATIGFFLFHAFI